MAFDLTAMQNQISGMRDMLPVAVTINLATVSGWRMVMSQDRRIELYGQGVNVTFSVGVIVSEITIPAEGDLLTIDGSTYRVIGVDYDTARLTVRIDVGERYAK